MNMALAELNELEIGFYEMGCPYNDIDTCKASLSLMLLNDEKRADCCGTENYDDCPIFMAKILRANLK